MYKVIRRNKEDGKELYLRYKSDIEQVTPQEGFWDFP